MTEPTANAASPATREEDEVLTEQESDVTITAERYAYVELKEAQRRCGEKAVAAALNECGNSSMAQQKVFQAHVNDLNASIFLGLVRQYNPDTKSDMEPVDPELVAKAAAAERTMLEKEAKVKALRESVPKLAAEKQQTQLDALQKRRAAAALTALTRSVDVSLSPNDVERLKDASTKTSSSVFSANLKLSDMISQTRETVKVVERAMKRPKTAIDLAMEHSPLKTRLAPVEHLAASTTSTTQTTTAAAPLTLRSKLAMYLTNDVQ